MAIDYKSLCEDLLAVVERPQKPPKDLLRKARRALELEPTPPLWVDVQEGLKRELEPEEWAHILSAIADRMQDDIIDDAGPAIGIYYTEPPAEWLREEARKALSGEP